MELKALKDSMEQYQLKFYNRKHMAVWCDDPMKLNNPSEIFNAAYQKGTDNPFLERYLAIIIDKRGYNITELKNHPKFHEILKACKLGSITFGERNLKKYELSMRIQARKFILPYVSKLLSGKLEAQTGITSRLMKSMRSFLDLHSRTFNSYLTILNARDAFVNMNEIRFIPKPQIN